MENKEYHRIIEAMLFASGEPLAADKIAGALDLDIDTVEKLCRELGDRIDDSGSAIELVRTDDKYQLCTRSKYGEYIRSALEIRRNSPLSQAAMEVLAIIAYNGQVTKNLIETVRGVDCSAVVSGLVAKGLIEEAGRLDLPGRPMLYATTPLFLRCFGMESLSQLPPLPRPAEPGEQISLEQLSADTDGLPEADPVE